MTARLILVKHSMPTIEPERDAREWQLSAIGRERCGPLAESLRAYLPAKLFCSEEVKAIQTAQLIGEVLGLASRPMPNLHEHDRRGAPYHERTEDFESAVQQFFNQPKKRVYGNESAHEALARFSQAIDQVWAVMPPDESAIVVAHGTVITLYVAAHHRMDPFAFWKSLKLPSAVALTRKVNSLLG